jgi:tRNA A37 threonylcarbamoyladenosine modification protein TsaB
MRTAGGGVGVGGWVGVGVLVGVRVGVALAAGVAVGRNRTGTGVLQLNVNNTMINIEIKRLRMEALYWMKLNVSIL